ncbi:MAG: leucine-rich repeat domain-containing protein [Erysipelotrichaceae bacterium]|nr:leucine-rich repeat domain-containing protein [Erysipelotrichaceae bacterium]
MKLEINENVKPYTYRHDLSIDEVMIGESVEEIGEGAFSHCLNLSKITIGSHVKKIASYAFDHIHNNVQIIWLSSIPYQSPLMRILPPINTIQYICTPYRPFQNQSEIEKRILACGYILHPEYENRYSQQLQDQYQQYILDMLPQYLNELCENKSIIDIFLMCRKRHLIKDTITLQQYISYIRTMPLTHKQKKLIDHIEVEEGLTHQQFDERDKKLLRYINRFASQSQIRQTMEQENITTFKEVLYREKDKVAPVEALKFILYKYISQWSVFDSQPPYFKKDTAADEVASQLDKESLQIALDNLDMHYPRRLIPYLRYASVLQLNHIIEESIHWQQYDIYNRDGLLCLETLNKAILLNDNEEAAVYALSHQLLAQYASMRGKQENALFIQITMSLEEKNNTQQLSIIQEIYKQKLYEDYLSGKATRFIPWYKETMGCLTLRNIASTLLWQCDNQYFIIQDDHLKDAHNNPMNFNNEQFVSIAHSALIDSQTLRSYQPLLLDSCFPQLKQLNQKYDPDDYIHWKNRYLNISMSMPKLQQLIQRNFYIIGNPQEHLKLSFHGKNIMDIYPKDDNYKLGELLNSSYRIRELNEMIDIMDDVLYFELIKEGKLKAFPYLERLTKEDVSILLEASIKHAHQENIAILLEYQSKFNQEDDLLSW